MTDLTAVDYIDRKPRFEVVYNLLSTMYSTRIKVKTLTDETTPIPSLTSIYEGSG